MAYYDALIAAWNGATQPPAGVAGTGLTAQMTTAQKIVAVNGWTVTGTVPTTFFVTGAQLANSVNYAEFKALTAAQQSNLLLMFACPGQLLGGSANTTHLIDGMIIDYFPLAGPTIAALTALAKGTVTPWWQSGGNLNSTVSQSDVTAAGLS